MSLFACCITSARDPPPLDLEADFTMARRFTVVSAVAVPAPRLKALVSILQSSSNHHFFLVPFADRSRASNKSSLPIAFLCAVSNSIALRARRGSKEVTRQKKVTRGRTEEARDWSAMLSGRDLQSLVSERGRANESHAFSSDRVLPVCMVRELLGYCKALRALFESATTRWSAKFPLQILRYLRRVPALLLSVGPSYCIARCCQSL